MASPSTAEPVRFTAVSRDASELVVTMTAAITSGKHRDALDRSPERAAGRMLELCLGLHPAVEHRSVARR